ncbi:MAG: FAD-binding oxidoreductase [candidate division Zixibacteria bacterium]
MTTLTVDGRRLDCRPDETVLDALLRHGLSASFSCRQGVCQLCMMRAVKGTPNEKSTRELKNTLVAQSYFLSCQCQPKSDLELTLNDLPNTTVETTVFDKTLLSETVLRLRVKPAEEFRYFSGQFVNLHTPVGDIRSYSLASLPDEDDFLEMHVRRIKNGKVSNWIHDNLELGAAVKISSPHGNCFYLADNTNTPMLLIGTGIGLAPLYGVLRDALSRGHTGEIYLYHGSTLRDGLYLTEELRDLASTYDNFSYHPCLSNDDSQKGCRYGRANDIALKEHQNLADYKIFLCGHPDMVKDAKKKAYIQMADLASIYSDPFVSATPEKTPSRSSTLIL